MMKLSNKSVPKLYAIYKNGNHLGNERGATPQDAIENYVKAALLGEFLIDKEFMQLYSAKVAKPGKHFIASTLR